MHSKGNINQIKKDVMNVGCDHMTMDRNQDCVVMSFLSYD